MSTEKTSDGAAPFTGEQVAWLKNLMHQKDAPLEEDPSRQEKQPEKDKDASSKGDYTVFPWQTEYATGTRR